MINKLIFNFNIIKDKVERINNSIDYSASIERDYNPFGGFFDRTYVWIEEDDDSAKL